MLLASEVIILMGLKATLLIDHNWYHITMLNLKQICYSPGPILSPLFFIVFMNDVSRASHLVFSILFADDTSVSIEGQNYDQFIKILNHELEY